MKCMCILLPVCTSQGRLLHNHAKSVTCPQVRRVVMSMDKEDQLEKDMVEQLLKYVPTIAERDLLSSHAHEMESFARPDHFLLEMSRYMYM